MFPVIDASFSCQHDGETVLTNVDTCGLLHFEMVNDLIGDIIGHISLGYLMVRFFHVVEIVGTTCELVGTSRVCFNHVVRSRACACTNVQRDASRHCRHYVIVLFHVVTCSTDAEPVCRAFLSSLLCRLLVITRKSRDCSVT